MDESALPTSMHTEEKTDEGKTAASKQSQVWGRRALRVLRVLWIPGAKLRRAFRRQLRRGHPSGFHSFPADADGSDDDASCSATNQGGEQRGGDCTRNAAAATDDTAKRSLRKRARKTLRRCAQYYGDGALLCGSPLSTAYIARDIQQRITANHAYVEMRDIYVPSYAFF